MKDVDFLEFLFRCYEDNRCIILDQINIDRNEILLMKTRAEIDKLTDNDKEQLKYFRSEIKKRCEGCKKCKENKDKI